MLWLSQLRQHITGKPQFFWLFLISVTSHDQYQIPGLFHVFQVGDPARGGAGSKFTRTDTLEFKDFLGFSSTYGFSQDFAGLESSTF